MLLGRIYGFTHGVPDFVVRGGLVAWDPKKVRRVLYVQVVLSILIQRVGIQKMYKTLRTYSTLKQFPKGPKHVTSRCRRIEDGVLEPLIRNVPS